MVIQKRLTELENIIQDNDSHAQLKKGGKTLSNGNGHKLPSMNRHKCINKKWTRVNVFGLKCTRNQPLPNQQKATLVLNLMSSSSPPRIRRERLATVWWHQRPKTTQPQKPLGGVIHSRNVVRTWNTGGNHQVQM